MRGSNFIDLTGKRFGRYVVIERAPKRENCGFAMWLCECDCGNKQVVTSGNLKKGNSKSCGCLVREKTIKRSTTHGHAYKNNKLRTGEYRAYSGMKERCTNKKNNAYVNYGGRGITICDRWLESFENFLEDMGNRPSSNHSIDRIDVNGNYEPSNCRWATDQEQAVNKRKYASNTTGTSGVNILNGKYVARISVDKSRLYLGTFDTLDEAIKARKQAEIKYR